MKNILTERFEPNTFIELGNRKLRTKPESDNQSGMSAKQLTEQFPESYPITYLDVSGMNVKKVCQIGGSGYVVDEQKTVRPLTPNQITIYRTGMVDKYPSIATKHPGEPIHVINCRTVGSRVDLTPIDKLEIIERDAPEIYDAMFGALTHDARLTIVETIWNQLASVK